MTGFCKTRDNRTGILKTNLYVRIELNKRNIKKLQKLNPNKYIQKDFHENHSKINQY